MEVDRGRELERIRGGTTGRVWEMGEERAFDGSFKGWKAEEKGGITQQCLKFTIEKRLKDGKNKR